MTAGPAQLQKPEKEKSSALQVAGWMSAPAMESALSAALTGYMDVKTFSSQCYLAAQDPNLARCTPQSLFKAFLECAQMGLLPGRHHGHVALVPRGGEVTVDPQWQGFKFLMERQPGIVRVRPVLVHTSDSFSYENGVLKHAFDPFDDERVFEHPDTAAKHKRKCDLKGGYLVIERKDREPEYHFVSASKIHKNRACAQTQKVWTQWFEEMCLKTVIRDAWSRRVISIDPQLEARVGFAAEADNANLGNDPTRVSVQVPFTALPAPQTGIKALEQRIANNANATNDALPDMATMPAEAPAESSSIADDLAKAIADAELPELPRLRAQVNEALDANKIAKKVADALHAQIDAEAKKQNGGAS